MLSINLAHRGREGNGYVNLFKVGHAMWTFSLPKMIRPYFLYHPELRGKLYRAVYETVQEIMAAAAVGSEGFRTGMVAVTATSGDLLNLNSHVHAIAPRGRWDEDGAWVPVPFIAKDVAERFLRKKVLNLLTHKDLGGPHRWRGQDAADNVPT